MENNCRFYNIEKGRLILDKSNHSFVIFSNPALVKCHLLVIPKKHVAKLSKLNNVEKKDLFNLIIKWQEKLLTKFSGCDLKQNYRPFLLDNKYKVSHLHFHLQPREFEDDLYQKCQIYEKDIFIDLTNKEANQLKNYLEK